MPEIPRSCPHGEVIITIPSVFVVVTGERLTCQYGRSWVMEEAESNSGYVMAQQGSPRVARQGR